MKFDIKSTSRLKFFLRFTLIHMKVDKRKS